MHMYKIQIECGIIYDFVIRHKIVNGLMIFSIVLLIGIFAVTFLSSSSSGEKDGLEFVCEQNLSDVCKDSVSDISFLLDDEYIALAGTHKSLWSIEKGTYVGLSLDEATSLDFDSSSLRLASCYGSIQLMMYNLSSDPPMRENVTRVDGMDLRPTKDVTFGNGSETVFTTEGFYILRWDLIDEKWTMTENIYLYDEANRSSVAFIDFSVDRNLLVAIMKNGNVLVLGPNLNVEMKWENLEYRGPDTQYPTPEYSPFCLLDNWTVMWAADNEFIQTDLSNGEMRSIPLATNEPYHHLVVSNNGNWLAFVKYTKVSIYNLATFEILASFFCSNYVTALAFSSDDSHIATTDDNKNMQIWVDIFNPNYNNPPYINITSHKDDDIVNNTITVRGIATDDRSVVQVVYRIDGVIWTNAAGTEEWSFRIDTRDLENGKHTIEVLAFDGEKTSKTSVSLTVDNNTSNSTSPIVTVDEPSNGTVITGRVTFTGRVWSPNTIEMVILNYLDIGLEAEIEGTTWRTEFDTRVLSNGTYEFFAMASDGHLASESDRILLTVRNIGGPSNVPPFVVIHEPSEGQKVSNQLNARGMAADEESRLSYVVVRIDDGPWFTAGSKDDWVYDWTFSYDTWTLENGPHRLSIMCADDIQLSDIVEVSFVVENDWDHPYGRPDLHIRFPENGSVVHGSVRIEGTADTELLVSEVRISIDDEPSLVASGRDSWSYMLDTSQYPNGIHWVRVWAVGVITDSDVSEITLKFENNGRPTCSIQWPINGQSISHDTLFRGEASDPEDDLRYVEISLDDGEWSVCTFDGQNWSFMWNVSYKEVGKRNIRVRAYDGIHYSEVIEIDVEVEDADPSQSSQPRVGTYSLVLIIGIVLLVVIVLTIYYYKGTSIKEEE